MQLLERATRGTRASKVNERKIGKRKREKEERRLWSCDNTTSFGADQNDYESIRSLFVQ